MSISQHDFVLSRYRLALHRSNGQEEETFNSKPAPSTFNKLTNGKKKMANQNNCCYYAISLSDVFSCTPLSFMANWKLIGVKLMRLLYWRRSRRSPVRLSAPLNSVDCLWWRTLTVWTQWPKWFKMKYFNNHLHS